MANKHISATQITTFIDCKRLWFFLYVLKLITEKGYPFVFGIVFHAVAERYLKSDDTCSDLNLYPEGWRETDDGVVTEADGELIRELVALGIEEGILQKFKGRKVEHKFVRPLTSTTDILGYIDLVLPNEATVVDHKTTKDFRYAQSEKTLAKDVQMLIYAGVQAAQWHEETGEILESVVLRHNQFLKNPSKPKVKFTEVAVPISYIEENWKRCERIAEEMDIRRFLLPDNWESVPGPDDVSICNKYGGCQFMGICGKTETIDFYNKRMNRILENVGVPLGEKKMGLFDNLKKKSKPEVEAPEPAPVVELQGEPVEEQDGPKVFETPPWAWAKCPSCPGHSGLNSKGNPCRTCNNHMMGQGLPGSSAYIFKPELDGWIVADQSAKEKPVDTIDPKTIKNAGLKKALMEKQGKIPKELVEEVEKEKEKPENSGTKRGRPPKGFTLCINCVPTKFGSRDVMSMDTVFKQAKEKVETMMKGEFYTLDQWKRKDALAVATSHIANELGSIYIIASNGNGMDYKACLDALRSFSDTTETIEGLH